MAHGEKFLFMGEASKVLEVSDRDFDRVVSSNTDKLVLFYAHWCGHCIHFAPKYKALADSLGKDAFDETGQARLIAIDCAVYGRFCGTNGIRAYPNLKHYKNGTVLAEFNSRSESLEDFARTRLGLSVVASATAGSTEAPGPSAVYSGSLLPRVGDYNTIFNSDDESIFLRETGVTYEMRLFDAQLAFASILETAVVFSDKTVAAEKVGILREQILPIVVAAYPDASFRNLITGVSEVDHGIWQNGLDLLSPAEMRINPDPHWKHCEDLSCGLWQFLHGLTLGVDRVHTNRGFLVFGNTGRPTGLAVMSCIRAIVAELFMCLECAQHFVKGYDDCAAGRCTMVHPDKRHTALWLWRFHNMVNNRTAHERGIIGKDTAWPTKDECTKCRQGVSATPKQLFDENEVYGFLQGAYVGTKSFTADSGHVEDTGAFKCIGVFDSRPQSGACCSLEKNVTTSEKVVRIKRPNSTALKPRSYVVDDIMIMGKVYGSHSPCLPSALTQGIEDVVHTGGEATVVYVGPRGTDGGSTQMWGSSCGEGQQAGIIELCCRVALAAARKDPSLERATIKAVKAGVLTELLADCLVSPDFDSSLRVRDRGPFEGFAIEGDLISDWMASEEDIKDSLSRVRANVREPGIFVSGGARKKDARAHALATFTLLFGDGRENHRSCRLHFLDLAGAEHGGGGSVKREDFTLKAFRKIIHVLSELQAQPKDRRVVAGWRDSKLTKLCQAGLGAGGRGFVLVPLSASPEAFGETLASLEFMQKARSCPEECLKEMGSEIDWLASKVGACTSQNLRSSDVAITTIDSASELLRDKLRELELFTQFITEVHRE
ncbi:Quiescin Q6 sulfhydryl oxidase [Perkinsus olseni]|uniref:Sulfhydryl oxidase n=1 Tax=Perkinsus olseni TaxID=32597 RepID=A0A7J6SWP7_PEROL|nr:Quiescin Q6 sulfhydryl oxidase [Perkinsus olseni]